MRIVSRPRLREFGNRYPDAKAVLDAWWAEAKAAQWSTPQDVKALYGTASIIPGNLVVFDICGNKYRLIVHFQYQRQMGYIRFIGTHAEYDRIDARTV